MLRRILLTLLLCPLALAAAAPQTDVDPAFARIRDEGLQRSQAPALFATLTDGIGQRLTASPSFKQAVNWARDRFEAFGLANAHLEPWPFGRGWVLDGLTVEMVAPRYMPLIGYAEAWSPSTSGDVVATPVMVGGKSAADVAAMGDRLHGAIVLMQPETTFITQDRPQPTTSTGAVRTGAPATPGPRPNFADVRAAAKAVHDAGPAVLVRTSRGEHGTVFVQRRDEGPDALPSIVLAGEHYDMIVRMLREGVPVTLRVNVKSHYVTDDTHAYNVVAELPGTDPALKDDVVMIGAHIDSWHAAEGAADNADGATSVLEAMRILKAAGLRPKRTIRAALWGGEEEGLLGSKAYVAQHLAGDANREARDRLFVYFNLDPGTGPIYGWYLENTPAVQPLFDRWLAPLMPLGARRNVIEGIGATDHLSFRAVGIPAFNAIQDYTDYDVRIHHTNADMPERVRTDDLKECAIALAWFAYQAAGTDQRIPRS
ncbi:MAG TPA: M20/M25/M40 family metallo-hydrolase [Vicinamibacterales bacterium]|nr:M20/M25/M40 family metallo-hydrolase [Vicinamibacterales bacterium]